MGLFLFFGIIVVVTIAYFVLKSEDKPITRNKRSSTNSSGTDWSAGTTSYSSSNDTKLIPIDGRDSDSSDNRSCDTSSDNSPSWSSSDSSSCSSDSSSSSSDSSSSSSSD